jgi:hypothetical protein
MVIDDRLEFDDARALTATAASTDAVDMSQERRIGQGQTMYVVVSVDVALAGTSPTFAVSIQTDDNSSFSSAATIETSQTFSSLPVGTVIVLPVPYGLTERFMRVNYTLGGTTPTITVSSWLTSEEPRSWVAYPDASN